MQSMIAVLVLASMTAATALAQPAYGPAYPLQAVEAVEAPAALPDYRPTARLSKAAPRWMVVAAQATPVRPAPTPSIRLYRAPPKDWRPSKRWAVGATVGSDGVGADIQLLATRALVLRARAAWANIDHAQTYDHVRYSGHVRLSNAGGFVDLHPLDGMLRPLMISAGAVSAVGGRRHVAIGATPQGSYSFGGHTYTAAQLGTVTGDIGLDKVAPFLGVGFDNTFDTSGALAFKLLAGVVFSGDPAVTLNSSGGLLSSAAQVQADLQEEERKIRDAAQVFRYYPAISTGLTYKF